MASVAAHPQKRETNWRRVCNIAALVFFLVGDLEKIIKLDVGAVHAQITRKTIGQTDLSVPSKSEGNVPQQLAGRKCAQKG